MASSSDGGTDASSRRQTPAGDRAARRAVPVAVFASGTGTNFGTLLELEARGASWRSVLLVSDREDAGALDRARRAGVANRVIPVKGRDVAEVADETLAALREAGAEAVVLAGYLRLVPAPVVSAYRDRMVNVHPALLPSFGGEGMYGLNVHRAVLEAGARVSGPTVHLVDERYDEGRILAQWPVPVIPGDTPETLQARVLAAEHRLFPLALEHLCRAVAEGREPGPFDPDGGAFALVEGPGGEGLDPLVERRFPPTPRGGGHAASRVRPSDAGAADPRAPAASPDNHPGTEKSPDR